MNDVPAWHQKVEEIFHRALERTPEARDEFLVLACHGDDALRVEVEALLEASQEADGGALLDTRDLGLLGGEVVCEVAERIDGERRAAGRTEAAAGDWIGNYRLLQRIGEGGFGVVWMAEQREPLRRRVALKIIKLGMDTKQVMARFEQERQALAMMEHPNIAQIFDAGATREGRPYFVMELVRGVKITDYCDSASLSMKERLELFITVCHAMQHAHQKGVIHRDLKPANILVTLHDGVPVPKVIDFGVAKATQRERLTDLTLFTHIEQIVGTPLYMAPEQAEFSGLDVDTRSDIYALGVLLYELLTGRTPFDPQSFIKTGIEEMRRVIREQEPPKPSTRLSTLGLEALASIASSRQNDTVKLIRSLRGDLDWIVMKALEKDRTRRYDTANAMADDVGRHLEGDAVLARPPSRLYRWSRIARKHRVAWITGATVLLIFIASVAGVAWQGGQARRETEIAKETLRLLSASAAGYAKEAMEFVDRGQLDQAVARLDLAIELNPDNHDYRLTQADVLQSGLRFADAAKTYRKVLNRDPGHPRASANLALCQAFAARLQDGKRLSKEDLRALLQALSRDHRPAGQISHVRKLLQREMEPFRQAWLKKIAEVLPIELPLQEGRSLDERLSITDDFGLALDLSGTSLTKPKYPVGALKFPARIPLERLDLSDTPMSDLRRLQDLPLKHLDLRGCTAAYNFSALAELSELETLRLPDALVGLEDDEIWAIADLRDHSKLHRIESMGSESPADFEEISEFWARYDLNQKATKALRAFLGVGAWEDYRLFRRRNWNWVVSCRGKEIYDLEPIRGLPVERLDLTDTGVHDLRPLGGMPLQWLRLSGTDVTDLTPLAAMPLTFLDLENCVPRIDLAPVSGIKSLVNLYLPPKPINVDSLRVLPGLEGISYQVFEVADSWNHRKPADFWANTQPLNEGCLVRDGRFQEAEEIIRDRVEKYGRDHDRFKLALVQFAQGNEEGYGEALVDTRWRYLQIRRRADTFPETVARLSLVSPTLPIATADLEALMKDVMLLDEKRARQISRDSRFGRVSKASITTARGAISLAENPVRGCFYHLTAGLHAYRRGHFMVALHIFGNVRTERFDEVVLAARAASAMAHWKLGEENEAIALLEGLRDAVMKSWDRVPPHSPYWLEHAYAWLLAREAEALVSGSAPVRDQAVFANGFGVSPQKLFDLEEPSAGHDNPKQQ